MSRDDATRLMGLHRPCLLNLAENSRWAAVRRRERQRSRVVGLLGLSEAVVASRIPNGRSATGIASLMRGRRVA